MTTTRFITVLLVLASSVVAHADDSAGPEQPSATVTKAPAPTGTFEIGAGFSSDESFIVHSAIEQSNLLHTGQRLALTADLSAISQRMSISHEIPDLLGFDLRTELYHTRRAYSGFTREATGGAVTVGHQLDRATRIYARYRLEQVTLDPSSQQLDGTASRLVGNLDDGRVATLGGGMIYDTLDRHVLARHGSYLHLFAERADRRLGSEFQFDRVGGVLEHARSLGPFTLRLHGHATYIQSRDAMGVPLSERLQSDGYRDVRGYALDSLGSTGSNLEAIGRVELELPVWRRAGLSIAGFADAGLHRNDDARWGPMMSTVQRSVGFSIIWRSPIGPLRFDVAFPLDGKDRDRQFLFNYGVPF